MSADGWREIARLRANARLDSIDSKLSAIHSAVASLPLSMSGLAELERLQAALAKRARRDLEPETALAERIAEEVVELALPRLLDGLLERVLPLIPLILPDKAGAISAALKDS